MTFVLAQDFTASRCVTASGTEYQRLSSVTWGQWMGESLELLQDEAQVAELEAAFQRLRSEARV